MSAATSERVEMSDDNIHRLPERDTGDGLTVRQRRVLEVIRSAVAAKGYPPSLREIGTAVGLRQLFPT